MKKTVFCTFLLLFFLIVKGQEKITYQSLDSKNPIKFNGKSIVYKGKTIELGPKSFFIDRELTDAQTARYPYVYNSVNEAVKHLTDGNETEPMTLFIAPNVYWIDNPDDPEIRKPEDNGSVPYGLIIKCEWLKFYGLTDNPENVVLAANRGQTIGAVGNFTLFKFSGQGTSSENITFGNYCNVDLNFPLKPALNRTKRASAIVQAQLIHCDGDKIVARNTRFISRLNLCPFVGGKRVLFDRCHFESTDDALCGTAVYLNCTLDFYSSKPFYWTRGTGAVFLNCDIKSFTSGNQFFTKANGQVAVIDTRFSAENTIYLGWNDNIPKETRNYQYQVSLNNNPVFIEKKNPASTVDMSNLAVLDAYRFNFNGKTIYNTYNLLAADDNWDPMQLKNTVLAAEKENQKKYTQLPTQLLISSSQNAIETNKDKAVLKATVNRFGNYELKGEKIIWSLEDKDTTFVSLKPNKDGSECEVIPNNSKNEVQTILITAKTASGLEAATVIDVAPPKLASPSFAKAPQLSKINNGIITLKYQIDSSFKDESQVNWYRCSDSTGKNAIEILVSRDNVPLVSYPLTINDTGYYIMASVAPKHIRSDAGKAFTVITPKPISSRDITADSNILSTDFKNSSTKNQLAIIPGFWTFAPLEQEKNGTPSNLKDVWYYGEGIDGANNKRGLLQTGRTGKLLYTAAKRDYTDMKLILDVTPFKTAGQGFSVAHMYMDVLIKYNPETQSGYGLRLIRTTKHHDAVDCILLEYKNGVATEISKAVTTNAFNGDCTITMEIKANQFMAKVSNSSSTVKKATTDGVYPEAMLDAIIQPGVSGNFGILYNGGSPTMINEIHAEWK
ncbi:hypothetical protein SAMN05443543_105126 [Flavobacterium flevense]|uniref:Pectinesterase catalytic domain-containing protein n=1 Tax=Flavobacterium flevense TaxID=983 RepID=A0A4Y4B062_9FLAO|nr:hypothetical protein [Flavobacterium flevense]GEC72670.1 hypothetical protein FFL01_22090 [Flavobacterium flevense]SHL81087.1 hypothetical protein SAMN05443543_105126 [Flavobacterium flevense]